ncbi:Glycosyltransferase involved in cell wall bisynthesis [Lachnospiraceae bacterium XBB2008]|nr:Glycosyltransferase involved in cell wall bisynthesis [Lachnospiraceae bacterium XBB2008]
MSKVSVIVPVYNTIEYLPQCIESLLSQTLSDVEIIIVNDGSTDDSQSVIDTYAKRHNSIVVLKQDNKGLSAARNAGLSMARGKYIYFCDSDDYIENNTLEECWIIAENNNADIVMFDATDINNSYDRSTYLQANRVYSGVQYLNEFYAGNPFPSACLYIMKRDMIMNNHIKFIEGCNYEDNDFTCQIIAVAERICYISQKFYHRIYREGSITQSTYNIKKARDLYSVANSISEIAQDDREINIIMCDIALKTALTGFYQLAELPKNSESWALYNAYILMFTNIARKWSGKCAKVIFLDFLNEVAECYKHNKLPQRTYEAINEYAHTVIPDQICHYLVDNQSIIGIYGKGRSSDFFLELFSIFFGEIKSNIIYIDSNKTTGKSTDGDYICNVHDICNHGIDLVVITSQAYGDEMAKTIKNLYGNMFKVIRLF